MKAIFNSANKEAIDAFLTTGVSGQVFSLLMRILLTIIIFIIGAQLIKVVRKIVRKSMEKAHAEAGVISFVDSFVKSALYVILVFVLANKLGVDSASIVALLGSAGVAIGLAVQGSLSNLAGGVLLLLLKPFKLGDYIIDGAGREGVVTEMHIFYTKLLTVDNKAVILPNGALANNSITNVTAQPTRRLDLPVSISYGSDIKFAKEILMQVLAKDEAVLKDNEMFIYVNELNSSSVDLCVRFWVKKEDYWTAKFRVTEECKLALDAAGVQIPFPQLDVHFDKPIQ